MREELFVPIVAVETVDSLDQALARANDTRFGLTAGLFSREQAEIDAFHDRIEAGVVYVNRAAGATTGAWPGVQPFGGWKGSGSTGKNIGGPLHPALLPARAEPDAVRMTAPAKYVRSLSLAAQPISIVTDPPGPRAQEMIARALPHLSPSLIHCYPLMVKRASGCMVEDVDGNVYFDAEAGVATASTGHCHPAVAEAIAAQAEVLIHICGTDFHYPGYGEICETLGALVQRIGPNSHHWQTFLTNSGTEAVEASIKLARHHTGRPGLIAFRGGFHGRTLGSLSLTASKSKYRRRFGPLLPDVFHATLRRRGQRRGAVHDRDGAATTSPRSSWSRCWAKADTSCRPPTSSARLREIADRHGILLVFDEVQSGMGRTGKMFAAEHTGVVPDIVLVAKGIASGMPLGAMIAKKQIMTWPAGQPRLDDRGQPGRDRRRPRDDRTCWRRS